MPDKPGSPVVPRALLEWLIETFPLRSPDPSESSREIWMRAGEQRIIAKLRHEYKEQNKRGDIEA